MLVQVLLEVLVTRVIGGMQFEVLVHVLSDAGDGGCIIARLAGGAFLRQ